MKDDGGPAFPMLTHLHTGGREVDGSPMRQRIDSAPGMTLRDYFAAAALQGNLAAPLEIQSALIDSGAKMGLDAPTAIARAAYEIAAAMLAQRTKP